MGEPKNLTFFIRGLLLSDRGAAFDRYMYCLAQTGYSSLRACTVL